MFFFFWGGGGCGQRGQNVAILRVQPLNFVKNCVRFCEILQNYVLYISISHALVEL